MYSENTYSKIRRWFLFKKYRFAVLKLAYKILPLIVYIWYPLLLAYLFITGSDKLLRTVTVPLGVFVTVSLIRKLVDVQRPYERLEIEPLIKKSKKGQSFPSRHTASAAVIAMAFLYSNVPLGILFLLIAVLIGLSRIFAGVHFPRDVIAGYCYAVVMAVLFLYIL